MIVAHETTGNGRRPDRGLPPLVEAMMRPEFYPDSPARVEVKQTHISYVFLADRRTLASISGFGEICVLQAVLFDLGV